MELSCDESAILAMNDEERLAYGKSIINYSAKGISCAVCLSENGKNIKERIKIIMEKKKRSKFAKTLSFMLAALIIFGQTAFAAAIGTKAPKKILCYKPHKQSLQSGLHPSRRKNLLEPEKRHKRKLCSFDKQ